MTKQEILKHLKQGYEIRVTTSLDFELAAMLSEMLTEGVIELRVIKPKGVV